MAEQQLYSIKQRPDTEEYHIFFSEKDNSGKCLLDGTSICGKMEYLKEANTPVRCENEKTTRLEAAKIG